MMRAKTNTYLIFTWNLGTGSNLHISYLCLTSMAYWQAILWVAALLYAVGVCTLKQATLAEDKERSLQQVGGVIPPSSVSWI